MLRGINRQNVFLDENDFESMLKAMREAQVERALDGTIVSEDNCVYFAYCILHNHIHILLQEKVLDISSLMKRIQDRYVLIYNRKYDRVGHLFQGRFASEPVEDSEYFHQLLRYIHRNPVKAMEATRPEDYRYSSWNEYLTAGDCIIKGSDPLMTRLCNTKAVIKRFGFKELVDWVNEDVDDKCMDMDSFMGPMSDREALERLLELSGAENVEYFKQYSKDDQLLCLEQLIKQGASIRLASRLSSLSYRTIWNHLHPEEFEEQRALRKSIRKNRREILVSSKGLTP